ncbi:VOC family protein [Streptomyces sp. NPDC048603]|uniref:VOC family protein n=1 Tax=Streptomyces sp. NPDC048603 TaxID=3365577 RepID=UPI00371380AB
MDQPRTTGPCRLLLVRHAKAVPKGLPIDDFDRPLSERGKADAPRTGHWLSDRGFAPPSWPRPEDSLQAHLRIQVAAADLDQAEREAVSLGARPLGTDTEDGPRQVRRLADPAGRSFVLATTDYRAERFGTG